MNPPQPLPLRIFSRFTLSIVLLTGLLIASLPQAAFADPQGRDMGESPVWMNRNQGGGGSTYTPPAPTHDYEADRRAQAAADAAAERQRQRDETDRIERERVAAENFKKEKDAEFIRDRDAAANTLKGSSGSAMSQLKGMSADSSGLKGSGFDNGSQLKSASPSPSGNPNVVNAQNVPSGLPKGLDNAIADVFSDVPPGVSDRVRKGFQAVMTRDWKVAKAWFQDALNHDPGNPGLKRLVALADSSPQPNQPAAVSEKPFTNEPIPANADKRTYAETSLKIHSPEAWKKFLFPEPSSASTAKQPRTPIYMLGRDGKPLQLPDDYRGEVQTYSMGKDGKWLTLPKPSEGIFGNPKAEKPVQRAIADATYTEDKAGNLHEVPEDYDGAETTYKIGKDNIRIIMPKPSDVLFLFP
jgi:hypothetical protein